jgi:hypothetical protein
MIIKDFNIDFITSILYKKVKGDNVELRHETICGQTRVIKDKQLWI